MRNIIFLAVAFFILNGQSLFAQQGDRIKGFSDTRNVTVNWQDKTIELRGDATIVDLHNRVGINSAHISDGNLIIGYDLASFRKKEGKLQLQVQPMIKHTNGQILEAHPMKLEGNFHNEYSNKAQQLQLIWLDFVDDPRMLDEDLQITLESSLIGKSPCGNEPPLFKGRWIHYVAGGISLGMIAVGYGLEESSDTKYAEYKNLVFDGNPNANSRYSQANIRNQVGGFLKSAGLISAGANVLTYLVRYAIYRKKDKDYQYYCTDKQGISFQFQSEDNAFGAGLSYQF